MGGFKPAPAGPGRASRPSRSPGLSATYAVERLPAPNIVLAAAAALTHAFDSAC